MRRQLLHRGQVEALALHRLQDVQPQLGTAGVFGGLVRGVGPHGDADAFGPAAGVLGRRQAVGHLVAPVDGEGRDKSVPEHLHLVVADHHHDVGRRLPEHPAQGGDGRLAAVEALVGDLGGQLGGEVLAGALRLQLLVGPDPAAKRMGVLAVVGGAQAPVLRRCGQHRPVRGADAEDDLGHQ